MRPAEDESVGWETTKNLMIEGDNLEVLKLLQKSYRGRVKLIYIDPPYNTGKDFVYPDDYRDSVTNYKKLIQEPPKTNRDTTGRFHTDRLNMIYPRLMLARELLTEDGVVFVSIDDNEIAHLRLILDDVLGGENFLANVIWERTTSARNDATGFSADHDFVAVYCKNSEEVKLNGLPRTEASDAAYKNPDDDPRGPWRENDYKCAKSADERPNLFYAIKHPATGDEVWPRRERVWAYGMEEHKRHLGRRPPLVGQDQQLLAAEAQEVSQ